MMRYDNTSKAKTKQDFTEQNRKAALEAASHGQRVFPVIVTPDPEKPDKKKADIPVKWMKEATTDAGRINKWWDKYPDAAPGMMTGDYLVIDLDDRDDKDGIAAYKAMGLDTEDALFAVETPSGGQHLYFANPAQLTNSQDRVAPGIDTRGIGGFVFAPGARTIFGEYRLKRGDLSDLQFGCLKHVPKPVQQALAKPKETPTQSTPGDADLETIRDALHHVSSDCGYNDWNDILMAVHHATGGSIHGLGLVIGWSAGHQRFSPKQVQEKWRGFGKKAGPQITADTLFSRARKNGWVQSDPDDILTSEDVEPSSLEDLDRLVFGDDPTFGLTLLDPDQCASFKPAPYVVKGLIAQGDTACIVGAPGVGKTPAASEFAYCVSLGKEAFGMRTRQGPVLYLAFENDRDMRKRVTALRDRHGYTPEFQMVADCAGRFKDPEFLTKLKRLVAHRRPSLVVVDTLGAAMPGFDENSSEGMGSVLAVCQTLSRLGPAVLLVHHDTKGGDGLPRGHSSLNGAIDMNLALKQRADGAIGGTPSKNKNGELNVEVLAFRNRTVELDMTDEDGERVKTVICEAAGVADRETRQVKLPRSAKAALKVFHELGDGAPVEESILRKACVEGRDVSRAEKEDDRRRGFDRAVGELLESCELAFRDGKYAVADSPEAELGDEDV